MLTSIKPITKEELEQYLEPLVSKDEIDKIYFDELFELRQSDINKVIQYGNALVNLNKGYKITNIATKD